jgi:hypothetical protein
VDLGVKSKPRTLTYALTLVTLGWWLPWRRFYALDGQTFNMVVVDP